MNKEGFSMIGNLEERCRRVGLYIIENKCTVRMAAKKFGISKSTVHKDVKEHLSVYAPQLYKQVQEQFRKNIAERHIRSGQATRKKYETMKR